MPRPGLQAPTSDHPVPLQWPSASRDIELANWQSVTFAGESALPRRPNGVELISEKASNSTNSVIEPKACTPLSSQKAGPCAVRYVR